MNFVRTITFTVLGCAAGSALAQQVQDPLALQPDVFTFGSGTTFYRQIFPDATVSLGFSATAMHWVSKLPLQIADHTHAVGANPQEKEILRKSALADWDTILLHRAREKDVFVVVVGRDDEVGVVRLDLQYDVVEVAGRRRMRHCLDHLEPTRWKLRIQELGKARAERLGGPNIGKEHQNPRNGMSIPFMIASR